MSLQTGPEDSHGRCGGDVLKQTVPDTSSSDRETWVANRRQSSVAIVSMRLQCECDRTRKHPYATAANNVGPSSPKLC